MTQAFSPIRWGMVGGGSGAFMGGVHRMAARLDGRYDFVAGALSSRPQVARDSGLELGLAEDRIYTDFTAMAAAEAARPDGIEAVSIVTPNHLHFAPAKAFLEAGIHVICDKPMTARLDEAEELARIAATSGARFLLTHTYSGYPMVRQARALAAAGALGEIRVVQVEYAQDWLTEAPAEDNKQASWRADPAQAGEGGAIGDIGTHAYHLAAYVTGLKAEALSADLQAFVPRRAVDDNVHVMLRYAGGARGMLWASQVAVGCANGLRLRVFGSKGSIDWQQERPDEMTFALFDQPPQRLVRGGPLPSRLAGAGIAPVPVRVPAGHPEGYIEAFATLYADFAAVIREVPGEAPPLPDPVDGLAGMRFVAAAIASSRAEGTWTAL